MAARPQKRRSHTTPRQQERQGLLPRSDVGRHHGSVYIFLLGEACFSSNKHITHSHIPRPEFCIKYITCIVVLVEH